MSDFINGWTKEKVVKHIIKNFKGKAFNEKIGACEYKTEDGKKCAVGLFIPEGHAGQEYEGGIDLLYCAHPDLKDVSPLSTDDMRTLQNIHDGEYMLPYGSELERDFMRDDEILAAMLDYVYSLQD